MIFIPAYLVRLMRRQSLGPMKLGPEDQASIEFANDLRGWTLEGRMVGTWTKIPHEVGAVRQTDGTFKRAQARYAKQAAMGLITGSADYVFVWPNDGGWIEFKSKTGTLTPAQQDFREWCGRAGVRHALARSRADGEAILKDWGVLQ